MIKVIQQKLSALAADAQLFWGECSSHLIVSRQREMTCFTALVNSEDVIGRDGDKEKIVTMLLHPANVTQDGVSFLSIVGIGGSGKTTLALFIFNDERILNGFPLRLWVCVGDDNLHHLNLKSVLTKILQSAGSREEYNESTIEELVRQIRQLVFGKKYLLILDDVYCENPQDLLQLQHLLKGGSSGSWVLVTTRSQRTAKLLGDGSFYELEGLSDDDSWSLFEGTAYGRAEITSDRVEFGKEIIKYCVNNPLVIRFVGSLLYGEGNTMWSSLAKIGFRDIPSYDNGILQILKHSYDHLESPLKSCFAYCALFPMDYRINKEMMISLWRAQGFIVPSQETQSIEDAGEEYILTLLMRCFLKDVERDEFGDIISFKLHPLMHYLAQTVANNEVCAIDCITNDWHRGILHVSVATHTDTAEFLPKSRVRTLLFLSGDTYRLPVSRLLNKWICLRALDLNNSHIMKLPDQISKLVHLRHLDLSGNKMMKVLPESFTKLKKLETLILLNCKSLRELPSDLTTLVKLEWLDLKGCDSMNSMPVGIGELTCLRNLTRFAVDLSDPGYIDVLKDLQRLTMIKGHLEIRIKGTENAAYKRTYNDRLGYLISKQNLKEIELYFLRDGRETGCQEILMEDMLPHPNLRRLLLREYRGEVLPGWATGECLATLLPNLVKIKLDHCKRLKCLPFFGDLPCLRSLSLCDLRNLEHMENRSSNISRRQLQVSLSFPSLCRLEIKDCPELRVRTGMKEYGKGRSTFDPSQTSSDVIGNSKLLKVTIDSVKCLNYVLWTRSLPCVTELDIEYDDNVEKLEEVGEVLKISSCLSSLRILRINSCIKLRCIGKGALQNLSALEELTISNCYNLTLSCDQGAEVEKDISVDEPSSSPLPQTLRSLKLHKLPKVVNLPEWMQHLTSLESLNIAYCKRLKSLPEWMTHLTSLTNLEISNCSEDLCIDLESRYVS